MRYIYPFLLVLFYIFLIPFFQDRSFVPFVPAAIAGFSLVGMPIYVALAFSVFSDLMFPLKLSITASFLLAVSVMSFVESRLTLGRGFFPGTLFGFFFLLVFEFVSKVSGFSLGFWGFVSTFLFMEIVLFMEVDYGV